MRSLGSFAAAQAGYLKARLGLGSDDELAQVNMIKLSEETGEVARAFLALRGLQRAENLKGSERDRLVALGQEVGDVVATVVILAHAVGLDVDAVLEARFEEIEERRANWERMASAT